MADDVVNPLGAPTTNYGWIKPTVGGDDDAWGGYLNTDLDGIDTTVKSVSNVANAAYPAANPSGYQTAANVTTTLASYLPLAGVTNGSDAVTGQIGEVISSLVTTNVPLAAGTPGNITSITLTAGDWEVYGEVSIAPTASGATGFFAAINIVTATFPGTPGLNVARAQHSGVALTTAGGYVAALHCRASLTGSTLYYLVGQSNGVGANFTGWIRARRTR